MDWNFWMRILNSEYFFLDLIEFNWMQLDSKFAFPIQNFELNSIYNMCVMQKKLILFLDWKT